jgi:hypothetical protein
MFMVPTLALHQSRLIEVLLGDIENERSVLKNAKT